MIDRDAVREALTGPIATVRTPFNEDGSIDYAGVREIIDFDIAASSKAIVLTAGDSHYFALSDAEISQMAQVAVEHTAGRAMVVVADRQYATPQAAEFARYAADIGADVLMVLPPDWAHSTTPETLVEHYAAVARHIPVMVVTGIFIPRGIDFALEAVEMICDQVEGVVAIKDDFCGEFARKMAMMVRERWAVWAGGQKQNHMNTHPYGCDGYLSSFISFRPEVAHRYWDAIQRNDLSAARAVIRDFDMPFFDFIGKMHGGFDAAVHGIVEITGLARRWRRKPYYSLSDEEMEMLSEFIKELGP